MALGDSLGMEARIEPELDRSATRRMVDDLQDQIGEAEQMAFESDGFGGRTMPGGGGGVGAGLAGGAAARRGGGLLGGGIGGAAKVLGTVFLGGVLAERMLSGMTKASGFMQASNKMLGQAWTLFWKPFGDALGKAILPWAKAGLKAMVQFNKIADDKGLTVGIAWLADSVSKVLENPAPGRGPTAFGGGIEGGAPSEDLRQQDLDDTIQNLQAAISDFQDWLSDRESTDALGTVTEGGAPSEDLRTQDLDETMANLQDSFDRLETTVENFDLDEFIDPLDWGRWIDEPPWNNLIDGIDLGNFVDNLDPTANNPPVSTADDDDSDQFTESGARDVRGDLTGQFPSLTEGSITTNDAPGELTDTMLAEGGVVTRPTTARIGEAGPEAVVPLDDVDGGRDRAVVRKLEELQRAIERQLDALARAIGDMTVEATLEADSKRLAATTTQARDRFVASKDVRKTR